MKSNLLKIFLLILVWVLFFYGFSFLRKTYLADVYYAKSQNLLKKVEAKRSQEYADLAVELNPREPNYSRGRAKVNTVSSVSLSENEQKVLKQKILRDLQNAVNLNDENLVIIRNSIPLYFFLSTKDLNRPATVDNLDLAYLSYARDFFKYAKEKYNHDAGVISLLAKYEKRLNLDEEYNESVELIKTARPDLLDWHESFR